MKEIVLIRLAAGAPSQVDVEQLRDYVIESINMGVLVLGAGAEISTMELPEPVTAAADIVLVEAPKRPETSQPEEGDRGGRAACRGRPP